MTTVANINPPVLVVPPGGEVSCELTVHNRGDIVEGYRLEVLGDAAPWASIDPPTLSAYPGGSATAHVVFRVPRSYGVPSAEVPFAVRVLPVERPDTAVVPEGVLRVGAYSNTTAELLPHTSKARRTARHEVAIDNRGNMPLRVQLDATDPDESLRMRVRPAHLVIPPGRAAFSQLTVKHPKLKWRGQPASRPFQVMLAADDGGPPVVLDGNSVQEPLLSRWVPRALAALLVLAAVAAGLWFGLLKPAIKSGANDAVAAQQAALTGPGTKPNAKSNGGGGNTGQQPGGTDASTSPTAGPSATASPTPPAPKPSGQLSGGRMDLNAAANGGRASNGTQPVAANTTFWLTDVVLGAPQGDVGELNISVGSNAPFLTLSLANFRSLDFHWASAIVVPAGSRIVMNLTCTTPGTTTAGKPATRCVAYMSWSGVMQPNAPAP